MIKAVLVSLKQFLGRVYYKRVLDRLSTREEFETFIHSHRIRHFEKYRELSPRKREEFSSVLRYLHIDPAGRSFLDIGPGYGDAIDICRESGAGDIHFVELDPFFYTYNRLKGSPAGFFHDQWNGLKNTLPRTYDLIWARGSFNVDSMIPPGASWQGLKSVLGAKTGRRMDNWLTEIEGVAAPGCDIILCPFWRNRDGVRLLGDVTTAAFTCFITGHGYSALPFIEGHNLEPEYPVTFHKKMSQAS